MHILVASSSPYRQVFYREAIEALGHEASIVRGGIECIDWLRNALPDVLVLETPLLWGGSDGVLEAFQSESNRAVPPVILVATGWGVEDWFELSRFQVDQFLFRVPTAHELGHAIASVTKENVALRQKRILRAIVNRPPITESATHIDS